MASQPYKRVPPSAHHHDSDESDSNESDSDEQHHTIQSKQSTLWSMRLYAFLWVATAGLMSYGTDFYRVIFTDPRVKRGFFHVALVCTGINICITAYLIIYLPYIKRIQLDLGALYTRALGVAAHRSAHDRALPTINLARAGN
ncbi:unnamed protein product [Peronospora belbahrii]|uniref:Uncharacterized protein n=1 Tax=Peronospora belbahrii TaxID=622444 RepID=A0AAU9KGL6_9STRA|nr:unnamed protein product [Peronospora belbahrii]CAH0515741.1 unnamed protein product [Peronospora belbahrii]